MHVFRCLPAGLLDRSPRGSAVMEYALLLALISIVCILALTTLGGEPAREFSRVGASLSAAGG